MTRPLTVVQLLPALESGGVERSTLEIAAALVAAGHRSIVVSAGGRLLPTLLAGGSRHIEMDIGAKSLRVLLRARRLRQLLADLSPDIVHARSRLPAWLAQWALRGLAGARSRLVTSVHGLNSPGRYSSVLTRGERVICVSETVRRHVLTHYPGVDGERLRVIPRGVDPLAFPYGLQPERDWLQRFQRQFPMLAGGLLLTLPGRGTRLKGHADAIQLLARLRATGLDARLLLLGAIEAGRERYLQELLALAGSLGVSNALAVSAARADIRDVLASSALVLQLSRKPEAFGRTVVEALSLGRPVLGYAHGGVGELLTAHFPAGQVEPGDAAALLATARRLLSNPTPVARQPLPGLAAMQAATLALYAEVADG